MQEIRNVAIIAHVDHGKTTLVDRIIEACQAVDDRKNQGELILDNNELERERGITILSKNVAVNYKGVKINIIDTPGHADFGGEVERVLKMADGVLLLVDAFEGPMPQTRFVLAKAIELGLKPIVVINKIDKENCRPEEVQGEVFDLMYNLDATEEQLDFETIFGSSKQGWMSFDWSQPTTDITPLLNCILDNIPPAPYIDGPVQMQIASMDFSNFVGRIAIGRVYRGNLRLYEAKPSQVVDYVICQRDDQVKKVRIKELYIFEGLGKQKVAEVRAGDLCALMGIDDFEIGDTISDAEHPDPLPRIEVDEPTMSMLFTINNSPFFGREGKYVTSRHLRNRLLKETERNLALKVEETDSEDKFNVYGRGVLHLSILVETMRREGYEFQVGKPQVIFRQINGERYEPVEHLVIDVPEDYSGKAIELVTKQKGLLISMEPKGDVLHLEFDIPSRGLIGLRSRILTATSGTAVMTHRFKNYEKFKGDLEDRNSGSLVSMETGQALAFAIDRLQDRGKFFVQPGDEVYRGQVVGENSRAQDLAVNVIKGKKLTNIRAAGSDDAVKLSPKVDFSLEEAMEYIRDDEYLEVTPTSLRMRKIQFTN